MCRRIPFLLVLCCFFQFTFGQSVQIPPLLQLEMRDNSQAFDPLQADEKSRQTTDYLLLGVEMEDASNWQVIKRIGGRINTYLEELATVHLPKYALMDLLEVPGLKKIYYDPPMKLHNEEALVHVQADKLHTGLAPLPQSYRGKDVVVGIIDTGIDYTHKDFLDPTDTTRSRIAFLWDQLGEQGQEPEGFSYGVEWKRTDLEAELGPNPANLVTHIDTAFQGSGHGTHVSGTAAGNLGMAPESDLIVVAANFGSDANFIDAAQYIINKAAEMGKPCVINLSLGSILHPHDGTDFMSEGLSRLVDGTEGIVIIASSGNDGDRQVHWGGFELSNEPASVYYSGNTGVYGFFRIPKADLATVELKLAVDTADYNSANGKVRSIKEIGQTDWIRLADLSGNPFFMPIFYANDSLAVELSIFDVSSEEKDYAELFVIMDEFWTRYNWTEHRDELELLRLFIRGEGPFDAWFSSLRISSYASPEEAGLTDAFYRPGDTNFNFGSPCDGRNVLCVGAYTNQSNWTDSDGNLWNWPPTQIAGDLANFSSYGPTFTGEIKPEIVGPGKVVASAVPPYNSYSIFLTEKSPTRAVFSGTSMSSPIVAGAAALLLQQNPNMTHEEVENIILSTAIQDQQTQAFGELPNGRWGYGKLNVYDAMLATLGVTDTEDLPVSPPLLSIFPNPASETVNLLFSSPSNTRGEVRIRDLNGREVLNRLILNGNENTQLDVSSLSQGMYVLEWTDGAQRLVEKFVVQ